ncbi:uncharacterized protein A1O9_13065 [Exophiala aquamarina CBS 119918]|uniref:HNH nuclease domain-containing protein n=1 Tax=Exophiala aquamarina CBS 119918 TaxID=1182545 RepID=A0A072NSQ1_9EURO|nr:uncharacterized protein A1O9_13065 [Exophiala aquamarina CBS 119918]KEF50884.1 hypothetical protein A1O9_13065 [Exophiala aquamarina CBS 119918]
MSLSYIYLRSIDRSAVDSPETEPYRWPVILRFQDYPFPDEIPARWTKNYLSNNGASLTSAQSSVTGAVRVRDQTCRMSKHVTGTQAAHIVPQHEGKWFSQNSMWKYNVDLSLDPDNLLNDMSNLVLLRSDLHVGLDERKFIFYPKGDGSFVVHLLEPTPDLAQLFHNVKMQPGFNCHPSFLFARFVHALLPSLAGFFSMPGLPRNVLLVKATDDGEELVEEEIADPEELRGRISASRSRSPKKRHKAGAPDAKGGVCSQREAEMRPPLRRYVSAASHSQEGGRNSDAECDQPHLAPGARKGSPNPHAGVRLEADPDVLMIKPHITNLFPSWYPGWEDVDKLRQDWLVKERARNQTLKRKRDKKLRSYGVRDVGRHTWQNTRTLCESRFVPLQKGTDRP